MYMNEFLPEEKRDYCQLLKVIESHKSQAGTGSLPHIRRTRCDLLQHKKIYKVEQAERNKSEMKEKSKFLQREI